MTAVLFQELSQSWNQQLRRDDRKTLLFIDNASSLETITSSHVKVIFLLPNLTFEIQILDQGIVQATIARYKKRMLSYVIHLTEDPATKYRFHKSINVLDALHWIYSMEKDVSDHIITNCFRRSGFPAEPD